MTLKPRRFLRPQFSLRTLMIVVTILALPLAVVAYDFHTASRRLEAMTRLEDEGHPVIVADDYARADAQIWRCSIWAKIYNHRGFHPVQAIMFRQNATPGILQLATHFPETETIMIQAARLDKASAEKIGRSMRLATLELNCPRETGALQALVDTADRVEILEVYEGSDINECDFSGRLPRLWRLSIRSSAYTGANLKTLTCRDSLGALEILFSERLTDDAFAGLGRFSKLTYIAVHGTELSHAMLRDLASRRGLRTLSLTHCKFPDDWPEQPFDWPELDVLDLSHTNAADAHLRSFRDCRALRWVKLAGCPIGDEAFDVLTQLPDLQILDLAETQVTRAGALRLLSCPKLANLKLPKSLFDEGIGQVFAQAGNCQVWFPMDELPIDDAP